MAAAPLPPLSVSSGPSLSSAGPVDGGGWTGFGNVYFSDQATSWASWAALAGVAAIGVYLWRKR